MSVFRTLAETIYEKKFYDLEEMEGVIETYFKIFLSDAKSNELLLDSIDSEKMRVLSEMSQLGIKRAVIEKQIFDAKSKIAEGRGSEVDRFWFSRANMAFRLTKQSIVDCQARLSSLSAIQKQRNIEKANTEDRKKFVIFKSIIERRYGLEYLTELIEEINILEKSFPDERL